MNGLLEGRGALWTILDLNKGAAKEGTRAFVGLCQKYDVIFWIGGHTHADLGKVVNGRSRFETIDKTAFWKCGHLSLYHGNNNGPHAISGLLEFTEGQRLVNCHMYQHTDPVGVISSWSRTHLLKYAYQSGD
jgi:hypothetical protein